MLERNSTPKTRSLLLLAALSLPLGACLDDADPVDERSIEEMTEDEDRRTIVDPEAGEEEAVSQRELARIALPDGQVVFLEDVDGEEAGSVTMLQDVDITLSDRVPTFETSALETFLLLTQDTDAVPRALVRLETDPDLIADAETRPMVDVLPETIEGVAAPALATRATNAQMCAEGTTSPSFKTQICDTFSAALDFCHNGTWHYVYDQTFGQRFKKSYGATLACSNTGRVRHSYRKTNGKWATVKDYAVPAHTLRFSTHHGLIKRRRKVTHERVHNSGFVRGESRFGN